ncbi:NAD(P)-binding domain-containing protein [Sodalis sp. RH23]|uniref:NAD(P)-binding domain-containing protein n=1 Tax=unclassified Sodalis (in: enterobacteria) TaxID=2636512 RepID=UPI0039B6A831
MSRIGILGVDALSEKIITALFLAVPDLQVFLSPGNGERAQRLARAFPCWTLDDHQAVTDEVEIIILSVAPHALADMAKQLKMRSTQTLISLVPDVSCQTLRILFRHSDCVRIKLAYGLDIDKPIVLLTNASEKTQRFCSLLGQACVMTTDAEFDFLAGIQP